MAAALSNLEKLVRGESGKRKSRGATGGGGGGSAGDQGLGSLIKILKLPREDRRAADLRLIEEEVRHIELFPKMGISNMLELCERMEYEYFEEGEKVVEVGSTYE